VIFWKKNISIFSLFGNALNIGKLNKKKNALIPTWGKMVKIWGDLRHPEISIFQKIFHTSHFLWKENLKESE